MSLRDAARSAAVTWKQKLPNLPPGARAPGLYRGKGPYPFCLPESFAEHNLLPEARGKALERFQRDSIQWHASVGGGPTNHLLSSQVQCVNALAPFVDEPDALAQMFAGVLPVSEVLPIGYGAFPDDHVAFEWIGLQDYLGERSGGSGVRGANTTSVDAAIRYRSVEGATEIALIEWKYIERYTAYGLPGGQKSLLKRQHRYQQWWGPKGPLRSDVLSYDQLFVEPVYQLFRQQCLAAAMEGAQELDAERVRVCVAAPAANDGYWLAVPPVLSSKNSG